MSLMLLTALHAKPALAQGQDTTPLYLSTLKPFPGSFYLKQGIVTMLNKRYNQSLSTGYNSTTPPTADLRYSVPAGYTHFKAWVGIDEAFVRPDWTFNFTVIGKNSEGKDSTLAGPIALLPGDAPKEINVPIKDTQIITLRLQTQRNGLDEGVAWWGDAQLFNEKGPAPNGEWQPECDELAQKLLAQMAAKDPNMKTIALNRFALDPDGFDNDIAHKIQDGLQKSLMMKMLTVSAITQSLLDTVKPGDDLPEKTRTTLHDSVESFYLLTGRISKREDKTIVAAAIYDLRTGKNVAEAQVSKMTVKPPIKITLIFTPDDSLRIKSFQWQVDDKLQDEKHPARLNSQEVEVKSDSKKHKIVLRWSGDGRVFKTKVGPITVSKVSYQKGSLEFVSESDKDTIVELTIKVDAANQRLIVVGRAGDKDFTPVLRP